MYSLYASSPLPSAGQRTNSLRMKRQVYGAASLDALVSNGVPSGRPQPLPRQWQRRLIAALQRLGHLPSHLSPQQRPDRP
ncbi:MAG: hypothetical protein KIT87_12960 [Anaerolineae bacterium]|nr:hypothetical protein [Anaerolineae bacterium]